jgi:hypothetical protein
MITVSLDTMHDACTASDLYPVTVSPTSLTLPVPPHHLWTIKHHQLIARCSTQLTADSEVLHTAFTNHLFSLLHSTHNFSPLPSHPRIPESAPPYRQVFLWAFSLFPHTSPLVPPFGNRSAPALNLPVFLGVRSASGGDGSPAATNLVPSVFPHFPFLSSVGLPHSSLFPHPQSHSHFNPFSFIRSPSNYPNNNSSPSDFQFSTPWQKGKRQCITNRGDESLAVSGARVFKPVRPRSAKRRESIALDSPAIVGSSNIRPRGVQVSTPLPPFMISHRRQTEHFHFSFFRLHP